MKNLVKYFQDIFQGFQFCQNSNFLKELGYFIDLSLSKFWAYFVNQIILFYQHFRANCLSKMEKNEKKYYFTLFYSMFTFFDNFKFIYNFCFLLIFSSKIHIFFEVKNNYFSIFIFKI